MSDTSNNSIITVATKKDEAFQDHLAYLARSDAHHDLKNEFKNTMYDKNPNLKKTFNSGIPKPATTIYHEATALAASIVRAGPIGGLTDVTDEHTLKIALAAVPDCTGEKNPVNFDSFSIFETGFNTTKLFEYKVVKFRIACSNNIKEMIDAGVCPLNKFGTQFVQNTKLGGGDKLNAALIVDFSQHHFIGSLGEGVPFQDFNIHYLMTPEVVNDPAPKPNIHNVSLFGSNPTKGVTLNSYIQSGDSPISYTSYVSNDPSPANNFFSNYNFTLSPIKQSFIKGKAENLIAELDIDYDDKGKAGEGNPDGKAPPLSDNIKDSKGENSVTTVLGYLKDVIKKITKTGATFNRVDAFSFNSKCQQKRGGDWFQVLACLDVKNRNFTQILPTKGAAAGVPLPSDCPVYLVTHDQIAVSYALLNGVNVIYIDFYGTIYVFKNKADKTLEDGGKPMEEILFKGLKDGWPNPKDLIKRKTQDNPIVNLLTYGETYTTKRKTYLDNMKSAFKTTCNTISTFLKDSANTKDIGKIQSTMNVQMKELFTSAVTLMFAQINLVDISDDVININQNRIILDDVTRYTNTHEQNVQITKLSNAINNIKNVKNRFGEMAPSSSLTFESAFRSWVTDSVKKLDVYRTAANVLSVEKKGSDEAKTFTLSRLVGFFKGSQGSGEEERRTDSHIFLPFIQSLDNESRKAIKTVLTDAIKVTQTYGEKMSATPERKSRTGAMSPNQLYFNKMGNLIQEALIFVITDIDTDDAYNTAIEEIDKIKIADENTTADSGISSFESTDALLLKTDYAELENFFASLIETDLDEYKDDALTRLGLKSKSSNYVTEPDLSMKPEIQSGGTFMGYDQSLTRRPPTPAFCDVSVKQITWPLITSLLVKTVGGNEIDAIKTAIRADAEIEIPLKTSPEKPNTAYSDIINPKYSPKDIFDNSNTDESVQSQLSRLVGKPKTGGIGSPDFSDGINPDSLSTVDSDEGPIKNLNELATRLYDIHSNKNNNSSTPNSNIDLMLDNNLGFHPLVPIYAMLAPYFSTLGPKAEDDPFFYTYFTYINILEKMKSVIETNYLNNTNNPAEAASAYLIGFGLNTMLIKSHTSILQNNEILKVLDMSQQEYFEFSLKNDSFGGLFSGSVSQDLEEETIGLRLVNNKLFTNFINNEVNIKEILQTGTPVIDLPNYEVLKERIFKIMGEIVVKVNADRGTPIGNTDGVAAGIQEKIDMSTPTSSPPSIDYAKLYPTSNTLESQSNTPLLGFGGKTKKNKKSRKHKKSRKSKKSYKNRTRKHSKKHKKSRKH